jgi:hypothetical protein
MMFNLYCVFIGITLFLNTLVLLITVVNLFVGLINCTPAIHFLVALGFLWIYQKCRPSVFR